ncbi:MAG: 3-hydroxyacyl-CoA dehydrogenase family protein [Bacteroidota bacterium]|nr:3-hydroxyacyl-CoA dehydrogenase family protein [Bacteroidota bacterium]
MSKQVKSNKLKVVSKKDTVHHNHPEGGKHLVCLLGDEQLVKEYSTTFQSAGIAVLELKSLASLKTSAKKILMGFELSLESTELKLTNLKALDESLPAQIPIVSNAVTSTVLTQAQSIGHKERLIGIAAFPTLLENKLVELTPSLYTSAEIAEYVKLFFTGLKKEIAVVEDSVGMVMPRILCQIINEALFTVQNDVANPKDIDTAMKFGTNYPHGPIEWGEKIGFKNIVTVLDALYKNHGEERYSVAPLLRQMAIAGTFWHKEK